MFVKRFLAVSASVSAATALAVTTITQNIKFDAKANTNMAVYWGQGPSQPRLAHFCADSNIDIIPIAFLNVFPDQVNGGYPGTNFGNQCGSETFKNKDGSSSPLLSNCPFIGPDIKTCQALGKKILLSLGGAIPTNQSIKDDDSAKSFAKFLWKAFGPVDVTSDVPRPFGDAVVDGFDFDIESAVSDNDATTQYRGYGTMVDTLRTYFAADALKEYYISGSPQCVIPDAHLAHPIETSWFDFLFIQFYNTPQCSARAYFDATYGQQGDQPSAISFDAWVGFIRTQAMNKDVKLYIGLPAAPLTQLAYDTKMYLPPSDVSNLIDVYQCRYPKEFGGIMVFEATYSEQNQIEGKPYVDVLKGQLADCSCAMKPVTSTTSSSTSATSSSTSSTTSSATVSTTASSTESTSSPTSATVTPSASASLQPYPSSTGIWNATTSTPGPTVGTGSSLVTYPSSTGLWNTTSTVLTGTGSSSIPLYPTSTGLWNTTSTMPIGTGSTTIPPYPTSTGIGNSTSLPGPTGTGYTISSVTTDSSTSLSSNVSPSLTLYPTGVSSGFTSSVPTTSVPYPINNGTSSPTTTTSEGTVYTTETVTVTNCPPEVTSCPVRTSVTTYPVTTLTNVLVTSSSSVPITSSASVPVTSVPTNSPETTTSVGSPSVTASVPVPTTSLAPGLTTTIIVTSYTTTCPVTGTTTVHGSASVYTTSSVSTVTTTIVSTVPVVPVPTSGIPPPTGHGPAPGQGGSSSSAPPSSGSGNSPVGSGSHAAPQPQQPAQGHPSTSPAHGDSSSPSPSSSNGNSPIGANNNSPGSSSSTSSQGTNASSNNNSSPSQPEQHANVPPPSSSSNAGNSPIGAGGSNPAAPAGFSTTLETSTRQITATVPANTGSPAPPAPQDSTTSLPVIVTQTLVPVPLHPYQTAHPAGSASGTGAPGAEASPVAGGGVVVPSGVPSGVPSFFPAGNGTGPAGASGSAGVNASASGFGPGATPVPFTGAGGRVGGMSVGVLMTGMITVVAAAVAM